MNKKADGKKAGKIRTGGAIAALIAAVAVFCVMLQIEKNSLEEYEKAKVYAVTAQIPRGKVITQGNCDMYIACVERNKSDIPSNAIIDKAALDGVVAKYAIGAGVILTGDMFESENAAKSELNEPVIAGFKAEDLYQVVGGVLRAGDRIHIYRLAEDGRLDSVWENVYVQAVFEQAGTAIENENSTACAQRVNIFLDKGDVEEFYESLAGGGLRVVKVCK